MPTLGVPGADLFYETNGSGPLLVLIAGAGGTGAIFYHIVPLLSTTFTVVTYDRRGHSQSILTGDQDYAHRLERDADDAAELIQHLLSSQDASANSPSAFVLGASSGAIVASTLLRRHPSLLKKVVCQEPPLLNALPNTDDRHNLFDEFRTIYDTYRAKGANTALMDFARVNFEAEDVGALMQIADPRAFPFWSGNMLYFLERELTVYPFTDVVWEDWERPEVREKLVIVVSEDGANKPAARAGTAIAEKLKLSNGGLLKFPGAHLGYFTRPDAFAACVKNCLVA